MKRYKHSLSHYKLLTLPFGKLVPVTWFEALPGDSIQQTTAALIRMTPLLAPLMHPVKIRLHHWFVPNRLIWDDWEDFITGGADGLDASVHPYVEINTDISTQQGTIRDYLGIPTENFTGLAFQYSALPERAYCMIFNEFYRDQQLIAEKNIDTTSGQDTTTASVGNVAPFNVSWEKDYFTTGRGQAQLGNYVTVPLTGDGEVYGDNMDFDNIDDAGNKAQVLSGPGGSLRLLKSDTVSLYGGNTDNGTGQLKVDMSNVGLDVHDMRLSLAIQRYQEARNIYGARYVEYLRYLGVRSSDGRLQRPEYLGGGFQTLQFSEVLSTDGANTGDMKGHGIGAMRTNRYRRFFEEHGIVMTLASIVPKNIYGNGVQRGFLRDSKEEYFQKELVNIGDQEIKKQELYAAATPVNGYFAYQNRYDEYRQMQSGIAGDFRDQYDYWHLARIFGSTPSLNDTFLNCNPDVSRVVASSTYDPIICMTNHSIQARRLVPAVAKRRTF